jgi:hypothetical protein
MRARDLVLVAMVACTGSRPTVAPVGSPSTTEESRRPAATGSTSSVPRTEAIGPRAMVDCWAASPPSGGSALAFTDLTESLGLQEPLAGMRGHAAAWGEVNGDGWADLFVGTFADRPEDDYRQRGADGPAPDRLLLGGPEGFQLEDGFPEQRTRTSGATFSDLDRDGDQDLVVSRNLRREGFAGTHVFENREGAFHPHEVREAPQGARSIGILDYDADGLLDLFIVEDRWLGGSSVLLRNDGDFRFERAEAGVPDDVHGLGVGVADLNEDGRPDIFVAGSNRLFVGTEHGAFREVESRVFEWPSYGEEDDVAGVAIADLNRDGRLDIVLGHHYQSTLDQGLSVPIRLYVHRGLDEGSLPRFEDVTEEAGLVGLPTKAPHVEVADFDNDGWPDILASASADGGERPAIFRHLGLEGEVPRFAAPEGLGAAQYWVTGGTADVDHDGRLDIMLVEWEPALPSLLLRNETSGGHWLSAQVDDPAGGIGARVEVYRAGMMEDPAGLLGVREVVAGNGYGAGALPVVHFGLGEETLVDLVVRSRHWDEPLHLARLAADQHVQLPDGCPQDGG